MDVILQSALREIGDHLGIPSIEVRLQRPVTDTEDRTEGGVYPTAPAADLPGEPEADTDQETWHG
jgi:hypothetical protein